MFENIFYFSENDETIVVRGCGFETEDHESNCKELIKEDENSSFDGIPLECKVCDTDLCNSATRTVGAFILFFIGAIINL